MKKSDDLPQDNLAANVRYLMNRNGHNAAELAEKLKGKVSRSALHYILNKEKIARIDTVQHIASVYGLSSWHLISPSLISDLDTSPTLRKMLINYGKSSDEGKRHIEQVAEREARYVAKPSG